MKSNIVVGEPRGIREALGAWALSLPKIALHRHFEGSLRLETLAEIAGSYDLALPARTLDRLRPHVQMLDEDPKDFHHYIDKFKLLRRFYVSKAIIQRIAREIVLDAAADNVRYLELRFNPEALAEARSFALSDVVDWVVASVADAQETAGTRTSLILQIDRRGPVSVAEDIVDIAIERLGPLVRAIDLAGDEANYPPKRFAKPFRRARRAGLHVTAHAGEAAGARSVWDAVHYLEAERIGHGIRSIEDQKVVDDLLGREITLEVCPTSNLQTGVVPDLLRHPLRPLFERGVRVTVNTDNPSVSATTVSNEYAVAVRDVGMSRSAIPHMVRNAVEAAFLPESERPWLRAILARTLALAESD